MVRDPKNPREPCAAEPLWWESMLFCALRELQRRSHALDPSDLSCVLTAKLSPMVGSGHGSSRGSLSFQYLLFSPCLYPGKQTYLFLFHLRTVSHWVSPVSVLRCPSTVFARPVTTSITSIVSLMFSSLNKVKF